MRSFVTAPLAAMLAQNKRLGIAGLFPAMFERKDSGLPRALMGEQRCA